jgi:dihydroorotate dehydrogenase (fumarate)
MVDLKTNYMGFNLKNPFIAAASPLSEKIETLVELEKAQASAVVIYSLFEEQILHEQLLLHSRLEQGTEGFAEALSYFPQPQQFRLTPDQYLDHIKKAKDKLSIPVFASLNGYTLGGWINYAQKIEKAGADAIECNIYYIPTSFDEKEDEIQHRYIEIISSLKKAISIPVAVKLSPFFTNMARMAKDLTQAGANALVLFNRFYQPDIDLDDLTVKPHLVLSTSFESRLALRWIAILYKRINTSFAATGGIHTYEDAIKLILAGADAIQLCSVLLNKGVGYINNLVSELSQWMEKKGYNSISQMKGSVSQASCADPAAFERANYMKTLLSI